MHDKLLSALALSHTPTAAQYSDSMHFTQLQFLLPKRILCQIIGWLAERSSPIVRRPLISLFRLIYPINMEECERTEIADYRSFNDFFTRSLKPDARPVSESGIISPVDGTFSCVGKVEQGRLLQAKNRQFSLAQLLANSVENQDYEDAQFATIYLAPANYHRVHVPVDSELESLTYVPGKQFSVNDSSTRHISGIYAQNERLIAEFSSASGKYSLVMVGALLVAGMSTVVTGRIKRRFRITQLEVPVENRTFRRGEEFGAFQMGSTVILLFPSRELAWNEAAKEGNKIRFGEAIGGFEACPD